MGVLSIAMGVGGIGLTTYDLTTSKHASLLDKYPVAFPTMLLCSLVLLVSLVVTGVLLLRRSEKALHLVLWLYVLEVAYFIVTALTPTGGAFAVGNVGLIPQLISAFPIWGFVVLWWASRQSPRAKQVQAG